MNDKRNQYRRKHRQNLTNKLLELYGSVCKCCGEKNKVFLTLDHIAGGGKAHKKQTGGTVESLYRAVLKEGYQPHKYRILCYNCNSGRERNGGTCPHELERVAILIELSKDSDGETTYEIHDNSRRCIRIYEDGRLLYERS